MPAHGERPISTTSRTVNGNAIPMSWRRTARRIASSRVDQEYSASSSMSTLPASSSTSAVTDVDQGRFAGTVGADDGEHLSAPDVEVDACEDRAVAEADLGAAHGDDRFAGCGEFRATDR
jgi:hypothetical protein